MEVKLSEYMMKEFLSYSLGKDFDYYGNHRFYVDKRIYDMTVDDYLYDLGVLE